MGKKGKKTDNKIQGWQSRFKNKVAQALDLPKDLMFDIPRTTMIGNMQLYVENHIGLLEFTDTKIRLYTKSGELLIHGKNLVIRGVMYREILIEGTVESLKWKEDGGTTEGS